MGRRMYMEQQMKQEPTTFSNFSLINTISVFSTFYSKKENLCDPFSSIAAKKNGRVLPRDRIS